MIATTALLLIPFLCPVPQEEGGSSAVRAQATFARALSKDFGFFDLADKVIDKALSATSSTTDQNELLLARCDIKKTAAWRTKETAEKLNAWSAAGSTFIQFLASSPNARLKSQAQTGLGEIAYQYGLTLRDYLAVNSPSPEERARLIKGAEAIFQTAITGTNELIRWWKDLPDSDEKNGARYSIYYPAEFYRALTYYYWALLYPKGEPERDVHSLKAISLLEDFAMLSGGSSLTTFLAYLHMGDAFTIREEWDDAEAYYQYVIEEAVPSDKEARDNIKHEIERRQGTVQDAYMHLLDCYGLWGKSTEAQQLTASFQAWVDDEGVYLNASGYRILLASARTMIALGEYQAAIETAELVAEDNERSVLRLEANAVMMQAIQAAPASFPIDLDILFGASQGAYFQENYKEGLEGLQLLLTRLQGHRRSEEFGPRLYYYIGRCWSKLKHPLESAASHQLGYQLFPIDDDEFTIQNAKQWRLLAQKFRDANPGDAFLDSFYGSALEAEKNAGGTTPDAALWHSAKSDYDLAKAAKRIAKKAVPESKEVKDAIRAYEKAIRSYGQIELGSAHYEKALNQIGICHYEMSAFAPEQLPDAARIFAEYLEQFVVNPENTPVDARARKTRRDMMAQADFYLGRCYRSQAKAAKAGAWEQLRNHLTGFGERYPDQTEFVHTAIYYRLESYIALGQTKEALAAFDELQAVQASDRVMQISAFILYRDFIKRSENDDEPTPLRKTATTFLHTANALAPTPAWQNLITEANLHLEFGEYKTTQEIIERVLRDYAAEQSFAQGSSRFYAQLTLVEAYLFQDNLPAAAPLVDSMLASKPTNLKVMQAALKIKVGYPRVEKGRVKEVITETTAESLAVADEIIQKLILLAENDAKKADLNKYLFADYWHIKVMQAYLLYVHSKADSSFKDKHNELIRGLERLAPDLGLNVVGQDTVTLFKWLKTKQ
jgi:hypothetical protein